jgi:hypothetical protein
MLVTVPMWMESGVRLTRKAPGGVSVWPWSLICLAFSARREYDSGSARCLRAVEGTGAAVP